MLRIFISYSRSNIYIAETLKEFLEGLGHTVWLDVDGMLGGEQWELTIRQQISECQVMLVIVTAESIASEYVQKEIDICHEYQHIIVPLVMGRISTISNELEKLRIHKYQWIDFIQKRKDIGNQELEKTLRRLQETLLSLDPLISNIKQGSSAVKITAMQKLGELRDPRAVPVLIEALDDPNSDVANEAAIALGEIGDPRATEALINILRSTNSYVNVTAIVALGQIADPRAVEPLLEFLTGDKYIRPAVAEALGSIGDSRAVEPLLKSLFNEYSNEEFILSILEALSELKGNSAYKAINEYLDLRLSEYGVGESEHYDFNFDGDIAPIVEALGNLGDPRAIPTLVSILNNPNWQQYNETRWKTAEALGKLDSPNIGAILKPFLADADPDVRWYAQKKIDDLNRSKEIKE